MGIAKTWASFTNAHGGVNGHQIKLIAYDDGGVAATSLQDVQTMVQKDHVVAVLDSSYLDSTWASYLQQAGVPAITNNSALPLTNADFYNSGGSYLAWQYGVLGYAKSKGYSKLGVMYCSEAPVCSSQAKSLAPIAKAIGGISVSYSTVISATQASYTAVCLAAKAAGVQALYVIEGDVSTVVDQCAVQGFRPQIEAVGAAPQPSWLTDKNMNGAVAIELNTVFPAESNPALKDFYSSLVAAGLKSSTTSLAGLNPWVSGELFAAAADAGKLTSSSTASDVTKALHALHDETMGGLAPPLNPAESGALPLCYFVQGFDGKFIAPAGFGPSCVSAADQQKVLSDLKSAGILG
jgi:branched-chain amino acid transport system substrate-binding protein